MRVLAVLALLILASGCSAKYKFWLVYETETESRRNAELHEGDLRFDVIPAHNGIMFSIENRSDQSATLIWDKSYFILPNGNSYKALNTDVLQEDKEVLDKAEYSSTIPSHSTFSRFTTSTVPSSKVTFNEVAQFYAQWGSLDFESTNVRRHQYLRFEPYWPIKVDYRSALSSPKKSDQLRTLRRISQFVGENNSLGLGLVIEHRGIEREYRFDIRITRVHAVSEGGGQANPDASSEYIVDYSLDVTVGSWRERGEPMKFD